MGNNSTKNHADTGSPAESNHTTHFEDTNATNTISTTTQPVKEKITRKAKKKKDGKPGFQLDDWLTLVDSSDFVLTTVTPRAVTRDELKKHVTAEDCWTILHGKVYDITAYMSYHPGGGRELMKGAGKDSTALFNKFHAYVEYDLLLSKCAIGVLVEGGEEALVEGDEDEEEED